MGNDTRFSLGGRSEAGSGQQLVPSLEAEPSPAFMPGDREGPKGDSRE